MSSTLEFGKAAIRLSLLSDDIEKQLNSFQAKLEKFGKKFLSVGKSFAIVGGAITAPFAAGLKQFTSFGGALNGISKRSGISVESLQALGFAAEQSGGSMEAVGGAAQSMATLLLMAGRGNKKAIATFNDLGLTLKDLDGLSPAEKFLQLADAISKIDDPLRQAALAEKAFGGEGYGLLPFLKKGAAGIAELMAQSAKFGPELSRDDANAASLFNRSLKGLWESTKRLSMQLGAAIVGPMTNFITAVQPIVAAIGGWVQQHRVLMFTVAAFGALLLGVGSVLLTTGTIILFIAKAFDVCKIAISGVGTAVKYLGTAINFLIANPWIALLTALAALIVYVLYATGVLGKLFGWFGKLIGVTGAATDSTNGLNDALNGIKTPDIDLDKLKSGLNVNTDLSTGKGLSDAKSSIALFDVSLARQQLGDANIPQQQLAELKQLNKQVSRLDRGLVVE